MLLYQVDAVAVENEGLLQHEGVLGGLGPHVADEDLFGLEQIGRPGHLLVFDTHEGRRLSQGHPIEATIQDC